MALKTHPRAAETKNKNQYKCVSFFSLKKAISLRGGGKGLHFL